MCKRHGPVNQVIDIRDEHLNYVPDSKVQRANMGPTWVLSAPDGPHVGSMNLALRGGCLVNHLRGWWQCAYPFWEHIFTGTNARFSTLGYLTRTYLRHQQVNWKKNNDEHVNTCFNWSNLILTDYILRIFLCSSTYDNHIFLIPGLAQLQKGFGASLHYT